MPHLHIYVHAMFFAPPPAPPIFVHANAQQSYLLHLGFEACQLHDLLPVEVRLSQEVHLVLVPWLRLEGREVVDLHRGEAELFHEEFDDQGVLVDFAVFRAQHLEFFHESLVIGFCAFVWQSRLGERVSNLILMRFGRESAVCIYGLCLLYRYILEVLCGLYRTQNSRFPVQLWTPFSRLCFSACVDVVQQQ